MGIDRRAIHQRLVSILRAFATVNGPQQLFQHKLLFSVYLSFLNHSDTTIAQLALDCILRFKPAYLVPYGDLLKKFYSKGNLRDAMLQFRSADEEGVVINDHRPHLLPILCRVMFGRLSARSIEGRASKDSPSARRTAILSFVASFCKDEKELYSFIYLMVRPFLPGRYTAKAIELQDEEYRGSLIVMLENLSPDECSRLPTQIHQGFLNTLEAVVGQLGHKVTTFVPAFTSIVLSLCKLYEVNARDEPLIEDEVEEDGTGHFFSENQPDLARAGSIRGLCYRRVSEIFDTFSDIIDFDRYSAELWNAVQTSLVDLPKMAVHAEKAPSLLVLLKTISSKPRLIKLLGKCEDTVPSVLKCFASGSRMSVVEASLSFIDNLLSNGDSGSLSTVAVRDDSGRDGILLVERHVGLLLHQFRDRLDGAGESRSNTWRKELAILCRVSDLVGRVDGKNFSQVKENAESLCSLLIPFLDHGRRCGDSDVSNVLGILVALIPMIRAESAITHYMKLSRLLGPYKTTSGISNKPIRVALAGVLEVLVDAAWSEAKPVVCALVKLCGISDKRVDEIDFEAVIPALGDLCDSSKPTSWSQLCLGAKGCNPSMLLPLVHCCLHLLFCEDGVIARGSFRSLKVLVALASEKASSPNSSSEDEIEKWLKILEGCIVPLSRVGLTSRDAAIRRYFILLLRAVAGHNKDSPCPNLHGDLAYLVREEEPDLDFFVSITHVQVHRRARALQRLRKSLLLDDAEGSRFSPQSISHVLLPLALHPVYETVNRAEDSLALEGIATVGAMSRLLSWSKYNNILWTTLNQFHRHPEQEPYLVGLLCSTIDGFHFSIDANESEGVSRDAQGSSAVWRALEKRFIPKIEGLLVKDKVNGKGETHKALRPSIVLAMLKLFKKLPAETFRSKLPRLLTVICDALKSKESDARDVARSTLAKIAVEIGIEYLADIIRELAITLTDGYRLHVRSAAVHAILLELSGVYKSPELADTTVSPPFDKTVPALMDLIQQDLFGVAQERKDADGSHVRFVKEAGGTKSMHAIELIASMIVFRPSIDKATVGRAVSSIQALIAPFLERLRTPGLQMRALRQIKDCLARIVAGLQRNPSITNEEVLPYVYATLEPFVGRQEMQQVVEDTDGSDDEEDALEPIFVTGKNSDIGDRGHASASVGNVVEWRPSTLGTSKTAKAAQKVKAAEITKSRRVIDGASAPKLTGSGRNGQTASSSAGVNDPAAVSAVLFGLQLLGSFLKRSNTAPDSVSMFDAFVPLLTACVCQCRDSEVVLLSLKCLGWLMRSELPSMSRCAKSLAVKTLDLLTSSGAATNLNQDLLQASFKMLTFLINYDRKYLLSGSPLDIMNRESTISNGIALPLDAAQMQVLLSFLRGSLIDSDQHNPAISLIKAIMSRHYVSAEIYDLMETLLQLSVRSTKSSLREQSSALIFSFLVSYPLSEERVELYLQQILLNLKYEYAEGRLSAISLVTLIVEKFPSPLMEHHCQMFFLPLSLQLVNDDSKECREKATDSISKLLQRLSSNSLQALLDYTHRWSSGKAAVRRMSLQLYGIFTESRPDFLKRSDTAFQLLTRIEAVLGDKDDWEVQYFALLGLEKIFKAFPKLVTGQTSIWQALLLTMTSRHSWVKLVSTRLLSDHLLSLDATSFGTTATTTFLVRSPGALYQVTRNFCFQLAAEEEEQVDDLVPLIVKSLTWSLQAMNAFPHLCFEQGDRDNASLSEHDESDDDEDDKSSREVRRQSKETDPVLWLMTRLSNMAKPRGTKRRQAVFKCFAAFCTFATDIAVKHMELVISPLHRAGSEVKSRQVHPLYATATARAKAAELPEEGQLVQDVLHLLEEVSPDNVFMEAYAAVKKRALEKSQQRKLAVKTEYVLDPQKSAQRRIHKQEREKNRRKRRVDDRRKIRGGVAKRRHIDNS
jgi:U3 small nucleolar RNA-associated protein 20